MKSHEIPINHIKSHEIPLNPIKSHSPSTRKISIASRQLQHGAIGLVAIASSLPRLNGCIETGVAGPGNDEDKPLEKSKDDEWLVV